MQTACYVHTMTLELLDGRALDFQNFHTILMSRYPQIRPGTEVIYQPGKSGMLVTLVGSRACEEALKLAFAHNVHPLRLDIRCEFVPTAQQDIDLDNLNNFGYEYLKKRVTSWHVVNRPQKHVKAEPARQWSYARVSAGTNKSANQLLVEDGVQRDMLRVNGATIVWRLRQEYCKAAWMYFVKDGPVNGAFSAFAATTNTILSPDFFGLGHNAELRLEYEKAEKPVVDKDPYGKVSRLVTELCNYVNGSTLDNWTTAEKICDEVYRKLCTEDQK